MSCPPSSIVSHTSSSPFVCCSDARLSVGAADADAALESARRVTHVAIARIDHSLSRNN
jgi:hypothetical protein